MSNNIVRTHPLPPFFIKKGGVNFDFEGGGGGGGLKFKKGVEGQVFLKGGGGRLTLFLFNFFKVYIIFTFRNYFTLCKIVLCI